ncbi:(S)-scoulerine 9-O-methyltransferase [Morella rubra]|uniref:(S)-scoulerine 9-O-methyltransferase n=1 Tax=Morella rubra TaxID=262757 RepID=A0A6A1WGC2_9ROSI|nr:(S)-scoulerine 9-O-methyltransferase [Morella rubra]
MLLFFSGKEIVESMNMLKDSVLDPGRSAFYRTHGVHPYEYMEKKPTLKRSFNGFIESTSRAILDEVLKVYGGFEDVKELLDVGGCAGASLGKILSVHPHIRGLNLDLAHVIADAPTFPGMEHIAGDLFRSLPHTQTILLQGILHNWDDDHCKKLLRNCWEALPDDGKVIVVESVIPQVLANDIETRYAVTSDLCMMLLLVGGKERTISEIDILAKAVGFVETKDFPVAKSIHDIELRKKVMHHP